MKVVIEIRPGEGGDDAKLLVREQARIYLRYAERERLSASVEDAAPAWLLTVEGGDGAVRRLLLEAGGHRWQRVPPTERHGRVHTSTVTVAVLPVPDESAYRLRDVDIRVFTTKDSGPGGQHRNKTESAVVMRHLPTGLEAKAASKSQHANRRAARAELEARVAAHLSAASAASRNQERAAQLGSGMRGDKVRTYRVRDDQVTDHRTGRKLRLSRVLRGEIGDAEGNRTPITG